MNFSLSHVSSLFRYTGISFTAGAVTHGFFSEQRSMWTAIAGVSMYLIGSVLDKLANPNEEHTWTNVLVIGIVASIGLGLFTGGLQHFPDSPVRSLWVVPLGFVMSLAAVYLMEGRGKVSTRSVLTYGAIGSAIVITASALAFRHFDDHDHDHHGDESASPTQSNSPKHSNDHKH